jgi:hypothetical protein
VPEADAFEVDANARPYFTAVDGIRRSVMLAETTDPSVKVLTGAGAGATASLDANGNAGIVMLVTGAATGAGDLFDSHLCTCLSVRQLSGHLRRERSRGRADGYRDRLHRQPVSTLMQPFPPVPMPSLSMRPVLDGTGLALRRTSSEYLGRVRLRLRLR